MAIAMARLTQSGHKISSLDDFMSLYNKEYTADFLSTLCRLPHPTLQKFGVINIVIIGASRRFLAQITRHQNEVKFMSASLQYSDYSDSAQFVVPYELLGEANFVDRNNYISSCLDSLKHYKYLAERVGNDAAGYAMPQGLRNVLVISATPFQWKHMISQRTCRRNTTETIYVMLRCWEALQKESIMFEHCGPFCELDSCKEGKMSCKNPIVSTGVRLYRDLDNIPTPTAIIKETFPLLGGDNDLHSRRT